MNTFQIYFTVTCQERFCFLPQGFISSQQIRNGESLFSGLSQIESLGFKNLFVLVVLKYHGYIILSVIYLREAFLECCIPGVLENSFYRFANGSSAASKPDIHPTPGRALKCSLSFFCSKGKADSYSLSWCIYIG